MRIVKRGRQALSDKQERNLVVAGVQVVNEEWTAAYLYKNAAGELVVSQVDLTDKMRA